MSAASGETEKGIETRARRTLQTTHCTIGGSARGAPAFWQRPLTEGESVRELWH